MRLNNEFKRRGGGWVLCQAVLLLVVFAGGVIWRGAWNSDLSMVAGAVLLAIAAFCGIAGTLALGRNLTPFPEPCSSTTLVQSGIYGYIRHPLYTAVFCGSLGWTLLFASWPALAAALCLAPFFEGKARVEERALRQRFPEYQAYAGRTKRFMPGVY